MLSPGAKGRFRRATTSLGDSRQKKPVPVLLTTLPSSSNALDSPLTSPKTPRSSAVIPEDDIERVRRLASGGSGCGLWVARIKGWTCCLKEIPIKMSVKHDLEEFEREVNVLSKLTKPTRDMPTHLVQFLGCQRTPQNLQIFMTLYDGNLNQVLKQLSLRDIWMEETRLARYATQILSGLNILHHRNIIHRDIKSHNIFYSTLERWDGTPRVDSPRHGLFPESLVLGDFGEAKILHQDSRALTCRGTTNWIAPEVLEVGTHKLEYSLAADVWSLGMVVYEMMTLSQPYYDVTPTRAICCIQEGIIPTLQAVQRERYPRIESMWREMVSKEPHKRPKVGELLHRFSNVSTTPRPTAEQQKRNNRPKPKPHRNSGWTEDSTEGGRDEAESSDEEEETTVDDGGISGDRESE